MSGRPSGPGSRAPWPRDCRIRGRRWPPAWGSRHLTRARTGQERPWTEAPQHRVCGLRRPSPHVGNARPEHHSLRSARRFSPSPRASRGAWVADQKRERDRAVDRGEQADRAGPEPLKLGAQLVSHRYPRADKILPSAGQRPQRLGLIRVGLQDAEAVPIGARARRARSSQSDRTCRPRRETDLGQP